MTEMMTVLSAFKLTSPFDWVIRKGLRLTNDAQDGDGVVHVGAVDRELRGEKEEDSGEGGEDEPNLGDVLIMPLSGDVGKLTTLQTGPRIGPRLQVGSGSEAGRRMLRPRRSTRRTVCISSSSSSTK
jgi:hypothetical protein